MNKDIQQLLRAIRRQGFTHHMAKSGHYRVTNRHGRTITVAGTPRRSGIHRARADLKRLGARL